MELEAFTSEQAIEPPLFQPHIVSIIDIVETDNFVFLIQQQLDDASTDEPSGPGD